MKSRIARIRARMVRSPVVSPLITLVLVLIPIFFLLAETWRYVAQRDDAYISYRFARNLAQGHGLVYNLGQRVEGFTNLLWTLLISGFVAVGVDAPVAGHWMGVFGGIAALLATYAYARALLPKRSGLWACAAPMIVVASPYWALWSTAGMEPLFFAALITGALAAQAGGFWRTTTLMAFLATLTRPDGVLIAIGVFAPAILRAYRGEWRLLVYPIAYAAGLAALTGARFMYYGDPLPNTFYAKQGGLENLTAGGFYLTKFLAFGPLFLVAPAIVCAKLNKDARPGFAAITIFVAYVVYEGGDFMPGARFLLPLLPAMSAIAVVGAAQTPGDRPAFRAALVWCLLAAILWQMLGPAAAMPLLAAAFVAPLFAASNRPLRLASGTAAALVIAAQGYLVASGSGTATDYRSMAANRNHFATLSAVRKNDTIVANARRLKGEQIRRLVPPGSVIATGAIGYVGYYSELHIVDIFGLTDPEIARYPNVIPSTMRRLPGHMRSHPDYVLAQEPDYIFINQLRRIPAPTELLDHAMFQANYEWNDEIGGFVRRVPKTRPSLLRLPKNKVETL